MNWKLRLKNKATLAALIAAGITFVYQVFAALGIAPKVQENDLMQLASLILNILVAMGILVDPTTPGVKDSERAKTYVEPGLADQEGEE